VRASKIARDIGERKRADEQKNLLIAEIEHRVKNTLATVQALAALTLKSASLQEQEAFNARLQALAGAHGLLQQDRGNRALLREVVDRALRPLLQQDIR
jgi:two-component sensor histidine kinase